MFLRSLIFAEFTFAIQMSCFEFAKCFEKSIKTLKIRGAIKRILDCFFSFNTLIENTNKYLPTEKEL